MNILFLTRLYKPHSGGVEKHVEKISNILQKKKHNITIVTTKYGKELKDFEIIDEIKVYRFYQPPIKILGLLYTWFWLFKNLSIITKANIVHIHDVFIWYLPFRLFFPFKKIYITFHGRWGLYPIPLKDKIQKIIGAKLSNGNICIGKYIPKHYRFKENEVSYGATDVTVKKVKKDRNLIIYVGRLDKDIALNKVLKTFSLIKGYRYEFCGDGELRNECSKYGKVHGWVNPLNYMKKANFCFASGYLTVIESLASHCLVFTLYETPLQKDYYQMTPFKNLIISSDDPKHIAGKINYFSGNPKEALKRVDKGYNWAEKQSWEKLVGKYLSLWGID